jgi:hypothetical protein
MVQFCALSAMAIDGLQAETTQLGAISRLRRACVSGPEILTAVR